MEGSIGADCASTLFFLGRRRDEPQTRINGRVIPIIRAVGVHPLRFGELEAERPTKERLLKLARISKKILEKYGLDASDPKTMCLPCTGCDLNPYIDL